MIARRNSSAARSRPARRASGPVAQGPRNLLAQDTEAFYDALSALVRYYQSRDRDRECCGGLSVTEWYALDAVLRGGAPGIGELGRELRVNKSTATRVVGVLEQRGLVERRGDPDDHKVWRVSCTAAGRALHGSIVAVLKQEQRELLADLSHRERVRVTALLGRLTALASRRVPLDP